MSETAKTAASEAMAHEPKPGAAPVAVEVVQERGDDGKYLLKTASGRYLRMAPSAYHLLANRQRGASFEEIAAAMNRGGRAVEVSSEDVEKAHRHIVATLRQIEDRDSLTRSGFWLRLPLLPEALVNRLTPLFSVFFRPAASAALLGLILVAGLIFPRLFVSLDPDNESLILGYVLLLVSLILHELGHASACAYFGARPQAIGFGVYLIYPVFYSDVSAAWELERWQRVVVDLAGLFFQFAAAALYILLWVWLDWQSLLIGVLMIAGSCAFSLNPIFKFDGYWMIADALGVHNLSQQPTKILGHLWSRLRGLRPKPLPWKTWVTTFLSVYSVLTFSIWGLFIYFVLPFFFRRVVAYPGLLFDFMTASLSGEPVSLSEFAVSTYMFLLAAVILSRTARGLIPALFKLLLQLPDRISTALAKQPEAVP